MQRGRGQRDDFSGGFGDPFSGFPGFGGRPGSLISSFLGGRDPFDDPFFTQPFGSMMGPSMFGPHGSPFGSPFGRPFGEPSSGGFLEQQPPSAPKSGGPIIKEISSDAEEEDVNEGSKMADRKNNNPRKHYRSIKEPFVQDPDEVVEEKKSRSLQQSSEFSRAGRAGPQAQTYSFQSSTVTYGGPNGAYYASSTTRKMGGNGVKMEEHKEADSTTGKATHRVSKGIHEKGHTTMRKLNSDGRVDMLETLHNLNEDELTDFNKTWEGRARRHLPGWNQGSEMLIRNSNSGGRTSGMDGGQQGRGWALPSVERPNASSKAEAQPRPNSFGGSR